MNNDEFIDRIAHHFASLFKEHGFAVVYFDPVLSRADYAVVGLESTICRISIEQEWGGVTVLIGLLSSEFGGDFEVDGEFQWYNLERVIDFISVRRFRWPDPSEAITFDEMLANLVRTLEPVTGEVLGMFRNQEAVDEWKDEFRDYTEEQFQMRYG